MQEKQFIIHKMYKDNYISVLTFLYIYINFYKVTIHKCIFKKGNKRDFNSILLFYQKAAAFSF